VIEIGADQRPAVLPKDGLQMQDAIHCPGRPRILPGSGRMAAPGQRRIQEEKAKPSNRRMGACNRQFVDKHV
jgi:hypothetical protein